MARVTHGYGVKTGAASICCWQADAGGITLWLDVSNGGGGVELGERRLEAATIVVRKGHAGEIPVEAARAFCQAMCEKPTLPAQPIYGSNNWYYAYGQNTSAASHPEGRRADGGTDAGERREPPLRGDRHGMGRGAGRRRPGQRRPRPAIPTWRTWPGR